MARSEWPASVAPGPAHAAQVRQRPRGRTIHVVGRLTPEVFSFLLPATQAIGAADGLQTLVVVDNENSRSRLSELHPNIARVLVDDHPLALKRLAALYRGLNEVADRAPIEALHLHGMLPGLAGAWLVHRRRLTDAGVYLSPHSSKALLRRGPIAAALLGVIRLLLGPTSQRPIVNLNADTRLVKSLSKEPVTLVESAVPDVFFRVARREAATPVVVAGGRGESIEPAKRFAQLAVLLGDGGSGVRFGWMGVVDALTEAELRAAGIERIDAPGADERARRLSEAWIYVAAEEERGFPIALVEAMASGLPCVVQDSEVHRDILQDGVNGFLCADPLQALQRVAELVDSRELRLRMGAAARQSARERFSELVFHRRLLKAYAPDPVMGTAEAGKAEATTS